MKAMCVVAMLLWAGCQSKEDKECNDTSSKPKDRISGCGQECDRGNDKACLTLSNVGTEGCMTQKDPEVCSWMCMFGKTGKDLYCAEYTKLTGKQP